jgi:hypothetical protein
LADLDPCTLQVAESISPDPHKLSHRVAVRSLELRARGIGNRLPAGHEALAVVEVLDEYQTEVERRLSALEGKAGEHG